jgi:hypothetical protein
MIFQDSCEMTAGVWMLQLFPDNECVYEKVNHSPGFSVMNLTDFRWIEFGDIFECV